MGQLVHTPAVFQSANLAGRSFRASTPQSNSNRVFSGVSFTLHEGRCLAIVGESGSGKSVTARALGGLAGQTATVQATRLQLEGRNVRQLSDREWRALRGKQIGFILQDALVSLDGFRRVGKETGEGPQLHGEAGTRAQLSEKVIGLLKLVGVPEPALKAGSYLFISHDLGVVHHLSDRVMVMKDGNLIEHGAANDVLLRHQRS